MSNALPANVSAGASATVAYASPMVSTRLGEELPIFCEKCGYSLFGLGQLRCAHCEILHFHCPECGHHQPINTLRPAAQRVLGRLRAVWLVGSVFVRLNIIGWSLFGWFIAGYEYARSYSGIDWDDLLGILFWGFIFGCLCRMMLLRWRRHWAVGLCVGGLAFVAMLLGMWYRVIYWQAYWNQNFRAQISTFEAIGYYLLGALAVVGGAMVVWYIWIGLVHAFLPRHVATTLLDWQRSLSTQPASAPARE